MSFLRRFTKRPPPAAKEEPDEAPKDDAPRKSRFTLFGGKKKDDAAPPKKRKSWFGGGKKDKEEIPEEPEDAPAVALAVDVPSERPNALHVALHRCRNLPVMDVNLLSKNSSDPFVVLECCGAREKSTTKKRCLDPYYGERFALPLDGGDESVKCTVFDEDVVSSHDFMGVADIACAPLADRRPTKRWYKLLGKKGDASKDLGEIQLTLHWVHDPSRLLELPLCEPGDTKNELVVALRRARHLRALDRNLLTENSSDPFAILRCDGEEARSKVVYNTCDPASSDGSVFSRECDVKKSDPVALGRCDPVWDEILTVRVDDGAAPVCLELRDKDVLSSDLLGFADAFAAERADGAEARRGVPRRCSREFDRDDTSSPRLIFGRIVCSRRVLEARQKHSLLRRRGSRSRSSTARGPRARTTAACASPPCGARTRRCRRPGPPRSPAATRRGSGTSSASASAASRAPSGSAKRTATPSSPATTARGRRRLWGRRSRGTRRWRSSSRTRTRRYG